MLTLAAMTWAAYMFCRENMQMLHSVPPPVVVETGSEYNYKSVENAIYVPLQWKDNCYDQQSVVTYMELHFNGYRNGNQKWSYAKIDELSSHWKCIQ